jgi:DNA polymerase III gamma/tau subunit
MIRLRSGAGAGALTNPDQAERLQKLANNIESKELYRILDKVSETIRGLDTQLNLQMALEALLLGWAASPEARSSNQ